MNICSPKLLVVALESTYAAEAATTPEALMHSAAYPSKLKEPSWRAQAMPCSSSAPSAGRQSPAQRNAIAQTCFMAQASRVAYPCCASIYNSLELNYVNKRVVDGGHHKNTTSAQHMGELPLLGVERPCVGDSLKTDVLQLATGCLCLSYK